MPFSWIVDGVRCSTVNPNSWSGLADYAETVRNAYRLNFWGGSLPHYVHFIVEKDAVAGRVTE